MERKTYTFSIDSPECVSCENYKDCKNKRKVLCKYLDPLVSGAAQCATVQAADDVLAKHDYRKVKIAENTTVTIDLEEIKKNIEREFYRGFNCSFLQGGA